MLRGLSAPAGAATAERLERAGLAVGNRDLLHGDHFVGGGRAALAGLAVPHCLLRRLAPRAHLCGHPMSAGQQRGQEGHLTGLPLGRSAR